MSKRIALIIGNRHYNDTALSRLKTPPADVHLLASILGDPKIGNFDEVESLIDQPAAAIRRHVRDLFRCRNRYDLLLLYFAGQAVLDEAGQLYLVAVDTALASLPETAVPAAYVTDWMDRSFSRRQILILDCCNSQVLAPGNQHIRRSRMNTAAAFAGKGYWRVTLTASDAIDYAVAGDEVGGDGPESIFTRTLIQGLLTGAADLNEDGLTSLSELHQYVYGQLSTLPTSQKPHLSTYHERNEFIIASNSRKFEQERPIKWDLVFGAIMAPTATLVIGGPADLNQALGVALFFLLFYAFLYWGLD